MEAITFCRRQLLRPYFAEPYSIIALCEGQLLITSATKLSTLLSNVGARSQGLLHQHPHENARDAHPDSEEAVVGVITTWGCEVKLLVRTSLCVLCVTSLGVCSAADSVTPTSQATAPKPEALLLYSVQLSSETVQSSSVLLDFTVGGICLFVFFPAWACPSFFALQGFP